MANGYYFGCEIYEQTSVELTITVLLLRDSYWQVAGKGCNTRSLSRSHAPTLETVPDMARN